MPKTRQQLKAEAIERNERWAALDRLTQFDRVLRRPGRCKRQRERIYAAMTPKQQVHATTLVVGAAS